VVVCLRAYDFLFVCAPSLCALVFLPSFVAYVCFGVYHCMFEFSTVVITTRIASTLPHVSAGLRRYALVFATNTFFALLFQVLLQLFIGRAVFNLDIRTQYLVFCLVLAALAVLGTLRFAGVSVWPQQRAFCAADSSPSTATTVTPIPPVGAAATTSM
jgi:Reduced folate carrier